MAPASAVTIELVVDFLDHAVYDSVHEWIKQYEAAGGTVTIDEAGVAPMAAATEGPPRRFRQLASARTFLPWSEWQSRDGDAETPAALRPVLNGVADYHRRGADSLRPHLSKLGEFQDPDTFFLSCVDSRVMPNTITSAGPGDLFTVRNMGNLIPAKGEDVAIEAALEYGIGQFDISSIVVCGHSGGGAMRGLLGGAADADDSVAQWLSYGNPSRAAFESGHPVGRHADELGFSVTDQLAMVNVATQVQTLIRHRVVGAAVAAGKVRVIGLFFDIPTARVLRVDSQSVLELDSTAVALARANAVPDLAVSGQS